MKPIKRGLLPAPVRTIRRSKKFRSRSSFDGGFCCCGRKLTTVITGLLLIVSAFFSLNQYKNCYDKELGILIMGVCVSRLFTGLVITSGGTQMNWKLVLYGSYSYVLAWLLALAQFFWIHYVCALDDISYYFHLQGSNPGAACLGMLLHACLELTLVACCIVGVVNKYGEVLKKEADEIEEQKEQEEAEAED